MSSGRDYGKIIVLAGAGASATLGLPTMQKFRKQIAEAGPPLATMAARMNGGQGYENAELIYNRLELYVEAAQCASDGDGNIAEAFATYEKTLEFGHTAAEALHQLQDLMLEKWGKVTCAPEGSVESYRRTLDRLYELNKAPLRVFTTNYDLAFESLGLSVDEGTLVNGHRYATRLGRYTWEEIAYIPQEMPDAARLVLYRLHGCSFWLRDNLGQIVFRPDARTPTNDVLPMVVFPARGKADEAYTWPFGFAYSALREAMGSAKLCVVVGYSFPDRGVVDALRLAQRDKPSSDGEPTSTHFVVVDCSPDSHSVLNPLEGRRRTHIQGRFGKGVVNDCLLSTCKRLLKDSDQRDWEVQAPGDGCADCHRYAACTVQGRPPRKPYTCPPQPDY